MVCSNELKREKLKLMDFKLGQVVLLNAFVKSKPLEKTQ